MTARKICLMGDSHTATLKRGWMKIADDFSQIAITFFAGDQVEWHTVHVSDGRLETTSPRLREQFGRSANGVEEIAADFDTYILCSLGLGILMPLGIWANGAYPDWASYQGALAACVRHSGSAHVLAELRKITQARALVVPAPFQPIDFCPISPSLDDETAAKLRAAFLMKCEALAAEHTAILVQQPEQTVAQNLVTTRMEFANIASPGERQDRRHCNAEYGAIVMTNILRNYLE